MLYALILAGGTGSRFWPLSRKLGPKQFLNICSDKPILQETIQRIECLIKKENIYIATNRIYYKITKKCLNAIGAPLRNILLEPENKNTLAPIAVYSKLIYDLDKDALIAVLPSDHYVKDKKKFIRTFRQAVIIAKNNHIVTLGINPTRPETGYGYIRAKINAQRQAPNAQLYYKVKSFIEKPALQKAKRLIKDRSSYWNSGIFIFRADTILKEIQKYIPKTYKTIMKIKNKKDCVKRWRYFCSESFDYAIMEKTDKAVVLPLYCGWSDLGNWSSLTELMKKNKNGNILKGRCLDIASKDIFVWSDNRLTATVGLEDIIVIDTQEALLVCNKHMAQDVKRITESLKLGNFKKYL